MTPRLILAAATASTLGMAAPAAACDLDGLPGFAGTHRLNPFANATRGFPKPARTPASQARSANGDSDEATEDRERRRRTIDQAPERAWESDEGNGPISAGDKATFT